MTDVKLLNKLAKACRKAGISHYKCTEFEFTLSSEEPLKVVRLKGNQTPSLAPDKFFTEELSDEERLFWSASPGADIL